MDKRTCCDKLWIKNASLIFALFFVLDYFQSHCNSWKASEDNTLWKTWLIFFPLLAIWVIARNQCDPVITSRDIGDQRILQSNWLQAFPGTIQEFPQIWDLYSTTDNNINFCLSTFPAKINDNIFQNKGKTLFWIIFDHIMPFLPKGDFSLKSGWVQLQYSPSI